MNTFFSEIRQTLIPGADPRYGPLPTLLVLLTVVTGIVDTFTYLKLGHVFVANSTGNILFLGFAFIHVKGFSITNSLLALAAIVIGAVIGGKISATFTARRDKILSAATMAESLLLAVAVVLSFVCSTPVHGGFRTGFVAVLGVAMGIQNAVARKIAVPDLTTTVLTLTITGLGADSALLGGPGSRAGRRLVAIAAMLIGAVIGAALELHTALRYPLIVALVLMCVVASWVTWVGRSNDPWTKS